MSRLAALTVCAAGGWLLSLYLWARGRAGTAGAGHEELRWCAPGDDGPSIEDYYIDWFPPAS